MTERLQPAVLCDLDGTLASCEWRRHHVASTRPEDRDWASFFAGIPADAPEPVVRALLEAIRPGIARVLVSARPEPHRYPTELWLMEHGIQYDALYLRPARDQRADSEVKREILAQVRRRFEPVCVIDDRASVVEMWRREGLSVVQVTDPGLPPIDTAVWSTWRP